MAGNWKMNLNHLEAIALVQKLAFSLDETDLEKVEVAVLPPYTDIRSVQTLIDGDKLALGYGAQDLSVHDSGAYTGDISGPMLAKLGCTYVVVNAIGDPADERDQLERIAAEVVPRLRR
jgi:triosephosphate isomerase